MKARNLEELEREGKKTLQELEDYAQGEHEEKSRQIVSMIAEMENVDFDELWGIFKGRKGFTLRFLMPEHAPIEYRYWEEDEERNGWMVYTGLYNSYYSTARNLGEALAMTKRTFEEEPWLFERTIVK